MIDVDTGKCSFCTRQGLVYYIKKWDIRCCGTHLTTFYLGLVYTGWMS